MRVLVTGGAGYIGSVVTGSLLGAGMEVTIFDRLVYGGEALLPWCGHPLFRFVPGDVRDGAGLRQALDNASASAIVHLAAVVGEQACAVEPETAWSINYEGTATTLKAAAASGVDRLIFLSTCSNYGVSAPNTLADETFPLKPLSRYAESKVAGEKLVLQTNQIECACVLRLGTICGLSPRMRFDLLVSELARGAALGEPLQIFAPEAWRPFLHVRDAARVILQCLSLPCGQLRGKVFNVVGENCQKRGLVELVRKHFPDACFSIAEKAPDLRDYRVSGERIRKDLGFTPRETVEDAFLETARAVASGVFRDPKWPGYSAVPLDVSRWR